MLYGLLLVLHLIICLALVCVVLIQSGKGGGLAGGSFGGSAQTVFGGRGATDFITRATIILGVAFFVTSLTLALMSAGVGRVPRSVLQGETRTGAARPAAPGGPPASPTAPGGAPATRSGVPPAPPAPGTAPPSGTGGR